MTEPTDAQIKMEATRIFARTQKDDFEPGYRYDMKLIEAGIRRGLEMAKEK
jgi:hypothetical protein